MDNRNIVWRVTANEPNPAGSALVKRHFNGVAALQKLLMRLLVQTLMVRLYLVLL